MMAARVAARLNLEGGVQAESVKGGLGEFSVYIDGEKVIDTNRFWYPTPGNIVKRVQEMLEDKRDNLPR